MPPLSRRLCLFCLALLPCLWLAFKVIQNDLGPEPAKTLVHFTGQWAFNFLCLTLAVTPFKRWLHWRWLQTHRRMLGLFALFYACLHAIGYALFLLGADWKGMGAELINRPYITVSIPALIILIALGATSFQFAIKALGKNWQRLHYSIYAAALLAWLHVVWQVRASYFDAAKFGVIIGVLLLTRVYWHYQKQRTVAAKQPHKQE